MKPSLAGHLIALVLAQGVSGEEFEVKLDRHFHVGEVLSVVAEAKRTESVQTTQGEILKKEVNKDYTLRYAAKQRVLEVTDRASARKVSCEIGEFSKIEKGVSEEILPPGTIVTAWNDAQQMHFEVDGAPVDAEKSRLLKDVIDLPSGGKTEDECFGTKEKKHVGETWEMNEAAIQKNFSDLSGGRKGGFHGETTLKEVIQSDKGTVLVINGHMESDAHPALPKGVEADQSSFHSEFSAGYPADRAIPLLESSASMSLHFTMHRDVAEGEPVVVKVSIQRSLKQDEKVEE